MRTLAGSDWSTVASLATAVGTLVLAIATFVAVRAANRAARVSEYTMQIGIRPLLMPSRLEDSEQKLMWSDEHWAKLPGGGAVAEAVGDNVYLALSLRNAGSGPAVIHGWHVVLEDTRIHPVPHAEPAEFRAQQIDLYVGGHAVGFWEGAVRDRSDPQLAGLLEAVGSRRIFGMELLYSDHEGGQRAIGRFVLAPIDESRWVCTLVRHWNLDRPDPR